MILGDNMADFPTETKSRNTVDVALNIFAKPFQTALSVLSLLEHCRGHIGTVWLQYEPYGSKFDKVSPYVVYHYLKEETDVRCEFFQPKYWLSLEPPDPAKLDEPAYRHSIRYQYAFEYSQSKKLFIMHNDIFVKKNLLGDLLAHMDGAFAIGRLGQCWNCPAKYAEVTQEAMGRGPCTPDTYADFRPDYTQLRELYKSAGKRKLRVRFYDLAYGGIFEKQPFPLPECRVNEWALLLDLEQVRPLTRPFGSGDYVGAFQRCGRLCLDTAVSWFRDMHAQGLRAKHFDISGYLQHFVGSGKMTQEKYTQSENRALELLREHYPFYLRWLSKNAAKIKK